MKENNTMMWVVAAAAAWFLWRQGTLDPYISGILPVNGNGGNGDGAIDTSEEILIDEGGMYLGAPPPGWAIVDGVMVPVNGVSGITDWGNIYD